MNTKHIVNLIKMNALSDMNPVSRWLDVLGAVGQGINTLPMNLVFADTNYDSDFKLIIGDVGLSEMKPKLKVYKGTSIINEIVLPSIPTGVMSFYTNENVPRNPPVVAVVMCSSVYIYKNMKLFFKFYLPPLQIQSLELDVWRQLEDNHPQENDTIKKFIDKLATLPFASLTSQSQHLLTLPQENQLAFIKQNSDSLLQKTSVIVSATTLNMNSIEKDGVACLVLGTENGDVFFLDPQTFTIVHQARVSAEKSTPTHMASCGLYDVEFRIVIATRECTICILRREWLEGKCLVHLPSLAVDIVIMPGDSSVIVACMDKTLKSYSKKGKRNWTVNLQSAVSALALVQLSHLGANLIGVALIGGLIQFYNGKNLVDAIHMQETIVAMKFGQMGQEEHVLALVTIDGELILKILKRTADFNLSSMPNSQKSHPSILAAQQTRPLLVPKKSKLFLEQASREREQAVGMHLTFQKELCKLRLQVAKATVEAMQNANYSLSTGSAETLKLSAQVQGLGPTFKIYLTIENLSAGIAVTNLFLLLVADNKNYNISNPYIPVPLLVPGCPYIFVSKVTELFINDVTHKDENGENTNNFVEFEGSNMDNMRPPFKVILMKEGQVQPLLAASIYIPPSDPLMIPFTSD